MNKPFVFVGSGLGYLWLLIWTTVVSIITVGLFSHGLIQRSSAGSVLIPTLKAGGCVSTAPGWGSFFNGWSLCF